MPRDPNCTKCQLHLSAGWRCVYGHGPEHAAIMLVGEAPGAEEDKTGKPFQGPAGKVLDRALTEAGLERHQVYVTNCARCRPPANRTPDVTEIDACLPYLLEEIETVRPRVIVALGGSALKALTGKDGITAARGKRQMPRKGLYIDVPILGTFHPAATLRPGGNKYLPFIVDDLKTARLIAIPEAVSDTPVAIFPPGSPDEAVLAGLARLAPAPMIACDLEWMASGDDTMIWPWTGSGEVYTMAFSGRTPVGIVSVAIALPLPPRVRAVVARLLTNRPIAFHNAMADTLWTTALGFDVNLAADTMLLAYLHDESQALKLEAVAGRYGGVESGWKGHLFTRRPATDAEWTELLQYNANDTDATLRALEGLAEAIKQSPRRDAIMRLHKRMLLPTVATLRDAALRGVPFDGDQLKIELRASRDRWSAAGEKLADLIGSTPSAALKLATSPLKTQQYVESLGIDVTDSRKDTLSLFKRYPAVEQILAVRAESKLLSTYLEPWTVMLERQKDGHIHTVYRPHGTKTGRMSAESEIGGSLQVTPRAKWVRRLIRAELGRLILSADYSTVEMRIIAWFANDPAMLKVFTDGIDIHKVAAAYIKRLAQGPITLAEFMADMARYIDAVTQLERQGAKGVNFGLGFGMFPAKLKEYARTTFGVDMMLQEAEAAYRAWHQLFARVKPWHEASMSGAIERGYTETPFGRRRSFDPSDVHAAINTPVQGTATDFTCLAMNATALAYRERKLDAHVIGFVHDSVLVDVAERDADVARIMLVYEMQNVNTLPFGFRAPIPFPAEAKLGEYWS